MIVTDDVYDEMINNMLHEMFEEMVAEGTWERVGDGRYRMTEKGMALHDLEQELGYEPEKGNDYGSA